jgi:hypothetical protein
MTDCEFSIFRDGRPYLSIEDRFRHAHGNSDGSHVGDSCGGRRRGGLLVEVFCHALSIGDGCDLGRGRGDRPRDDSFVGGSGD